MNSNDIQAMPSPPSLMKALMAGFDAISSHISLVSFSIALDLFLLFGPRLRMTALFREAFSQSAGMLDEQSRHLLENLQTMIEQLNLLRVVRTFPVGIPSLMVGRLLQQNPLGTPVTYEVPTAFSALAAWLAISLVGLSLGALYFQAVNQAALSGKIHWRDVLLQWPQTSAQVIVLAILWLMLFFFIMIPSTCFLSVLMLSGVGSSQLAIVIAVLFGGLFIWLVVPLVFSPHGIFVNRRPAWLSVMDSVRITRSTLPSTLLLFLIFILLSEGLDVLWNAPADSSWWMLVGIAGHAFVTTSLLAASFIYYRDADLWVQSRLRKPRLSVA